MAAAWKNQQADTGLAGLTFDERFALRVDAEHIARDSRRIAKLLADAHLRIGDACIEDVETGAARGLEKALARQLGTCA